MIFSSARPARTLTGRRGATDGNHLLAVNDVVSVTNSKVGGGLSGTWSGVKVTAVTANTLTFSLATAIDPAVDHAFTGYVFNNAGIVLAVDGVAGDIVNKGASIPVTVLNGD